MSKANNLTDFLVNTANAIRTAEGSTALINPQDFESHILALGGGITPTGNIELTTNLSTDVSSYATATVRSASGYSLSASGNSSTHVTIGSLSNGYYPVSATLTGSLTASTPGWFSSSGTVSAGTQVVGRIRKANIIQEDYINGGTPSKIFYTLSLNKLFLHTTPANTGYLANGYMTVSRPKPMYPFGNCLDSASFNVTDTTMIQRYTDWQITISANDNFNSSVGYYVSKTALFSTSNTTTTVSSAIADSSTVTFTAGGRAVILNIWSDEIPPSSDDWSINLIIKNAYGQEIINFENDLDYIWGQPCISLGLDVDISNDNGTARTMSSITIMIYWAYNSNKMNFYMLY